MTRVVILENKYKLGARPAHDRQGHGKANRVHDRLDPLSVVTCLTKLRFQRKRRMIALSKMLIANKAIS